MKVQGSLYYRALLNNHHNDLLSVVYENIITAILFAVTRVRYIMIYRMKDIDKMLTVDRVFYV
jgi:hypothetical protein